MNIFGKSRVASMLRSLLTAGLAALPIPQAPAAVGTGFHAYELGDNSRGRKDGDRFISRAEALADLQVLAGAIDENSAYIWSSTFDYHKSIEQISSALPERVSVNGLATQLNRFVRLFGDDHAQLVGWENRIPQAGLPVRIGKAGARYFLYTSSPAGFLDSSHPYVRAIDGVVIEEWMRVAGDIGQGPLSSPAARFSRAQRIFCYVDYLRGEMGLSTGGAVTLEMVSEDGTRSATLRVPLQANLDPPPKPFFLPEESRMLANNIGYLRVFTHTGAASERLVREIPRLMEEFRGTDALIIDARQCGGGRRAVLNTLFPYFMPAEAKPHVFNVVKLRKSQVKPGQDPATLFDDGDKRFLYVDDPGLPEADLAAYREFARNFIPTWTPPVEKFTNWFFMALRPDASKPYYGKPVFLLIDWGIGSAGDIFVSAFKNWPGITLVGTPTMGRSGQGREYRLPNSGLAVNLSTMASFQRNGERYDTVGIRPDLDIEPIPTDWLGRSDSVLDRVQALIAMRLGKPVITPPTEQGK
jgi:C-terminal processing protease CtpA/Prc